MKRETNILLLLKVLTRVDFRYAKSIPYTTAVFFFNLIRGIGVPKPFEISVKLKSVKV